MAIIAYDATSSLLSADVLRAWVAPAIIFAAAIIVGLLGLRWIRSEHLETLRAVPLFSLLSDQELGTVLRSARVAGFEPGTR